MRLTISQAFYFGTNGSTVLDTFPSNVIIYIFKNNCHTEFIGLLPSFIVIFQSNGNQDTY